MKTLYLDLSMGAAGDMLTAALYELLDEDEKKDFLSRINSAGIPGVSVVAEKRNRCGITGTGIEVLVNGVIEGSTDHHHEHDHEGHDEGHHDGHHGHQHSSPGDIYAVIDKLLFSEYVKKNAKDVYDLIADAESRAHDMPVSDIHFHEVGTMDAVADVTAVCILMEMLKPQKVYASSVCTGFGKVKCAHGILPVPAPATAFLLEGIPSYPGDIEGELITPTGAALIRHFVDDFKKVPAITTRKIGYGMGIKEFEAANCVRAMLGEADDLFETIVEISCNVDDMTAEDIAYATEKLLEEGAVDVYTIPALMKKGRPGTVISVMCHEDEAERFAHLMLAFTSTIGVRQQCFKRYTLSRRSMINESPYGSIRVKVSEGFGISKRKYEFDDIKRVADEKGISTAEARRLLDGRYDDQ